MSEVPAQAGERNETVTNIKIRTVDNRRVTPWKCLLTIFIGQIFFAFFSIAF